MRSTSIWKMGAFLSLFFPTALQGNYLVEQSYDQKLRSSALVIVGRAVGPSRSTGGPTDQAVDVAVLSTIKGHSSRRIRVYTSSPDVEGDPRCCRTGATYVMFLNRASNGVYESVNGRFGLILIG